MISVVYTNHFLKSAKRLDKKIQNKLAGAIIIIQKNPFSPVLHTKHPAGKLAGFFSFRITRDWRRQEGRWDIK